MKEIITLPSIIINVFILLTYLHALLKLKTKKVINKYLFYILSISFFSEIINACLKYNEISNTAFTSISLIVISIFWFLILYMIFDTKKLIIAIIIVFSLFAVANLLFLEGTIQFNYYTLVLGSFLYLLLFVYECFRQIKKDNYYFFKSNKYILILSPIIFFIGVGLYFFLNTNSLTFSNIIENLKMLVYFNIIINVIFYLFLNYYILKEKN